MTKEEYETMLISRHSKPVFEKLKSAYIGVAGLGGLGSNIAMMLTRAGIGRLLLVDFDCVEPSNLNRQHYFIEHLGMKKTEALKQQLLKANPYIQIDTLDIYITEANAPHIFGSCDIVCEAFDRPEAKAGLITGLLSCHNHLPVISGCGMAGFESSNSIRTIRRMKNLYICGDRTTEISDTMSLMAPRVQICAGHEANMAVRLLLGLTDV